MKDTFDKIFPELLVDEGGFVNDPSDPGGATNLGITLDTARKARLDKDGDGDVDVEDVKRITPADAVKVYRPMYWDAVKGDLLPSGLDYSVFDFGVLAGPRTALKSLQVTLGVTPDGIVGNDTLSAVAQHDIEELIDDYTTARLKYLQSLKGWARYGGGWSKRVEVVKQTSLKLAKQTLVGSIVPPVVPNESLVTGLFGILLRLLAVFFKV